MAISSYLEMLYGGRLALGVMSKEVGGAARCAAQCVSHGNLPLAARPRTTDVGDVMTGWASTDPHTQVITVHGLEKPEDGRAEECWFWSNDYHLLKRHFGGQVADDEFSLSPDADMEARIAHEVAARSQAAQNRIAELEAQLAESKKPASKTN